MTKNTIKDKTEISPTATKVFNVHKIQMLALNKFRLK